MNKDNRKERDALNRLNDLLIEDILNSSDEDVFSELKEKKIDLAHNATAMLSILDKSVIVMNKQCLMAARAGVAADHIRNQSSSLPVDIAKARRQLRSILNASPQDGLVTLAARNESELSDADVLGMVENLRELGALPDDGKDS